MGWWDKLIGKKSAPAPSKTPILATVTLPDRGEAETVFGDQPLRKQWAEDVLRAEGVPINLHLPMIESEAQITLRAPREVADRLSALCLVAARGSGLSVEETRRFMSERGIEPLLTPRERAFIDTDEPESHDCIQFSWRYEAAWVLFWALQHVDGQLGLPRATCDVDTMTAAVIHTDDLARNGLRSANDILCEADIIYRCHWAVRQAGIDGAPPPAGLHPGVTMERHRALNWLIGYAENADWDEVTTDT